MKNTHALKLLLPDLYLPTFLSNTWIVAVFIKPKTLQTLKVEYTKCYKV